MIIYGVSYLNFLHGATRVGGSDHADISYFSPNSSTQTVRSLLTNHLPCAIVYLSVFFIGGAAMDIQKLQALAVIQEAGSFSRAAETLGYS